MKNILRTTLAMVVASALTACGGGGSESTKTEPPTSTTPPPAELTTIKGMAIDGYIVGATVFMDLNFNGVLDDGEPSAVTIEPDAENPSFIIEVPNVHEDCGQYVPLITHVPVGAIDLDDPDNPIEEAYDLVIPPSFALRTDEDLLNVTPLTTVIWSEVEKELKADDTELSCESIIDNQHLREDIEQRLIDQEIRVARRYNTTVTDLYSDYIAKGNSELHGLARSLVPGLAKSYADTIEIEKANPNAAYAYVEYFMTTIDGIAQGNSWNRLEYIQQSPGNWDQRINAMSGGLNHITELIEQSQQRNTISNGLQVETTAVLDNEMCTTTESYLEHDGTVGYALTNMASIFGSVDWAACVGMDKIINNVSQVLATKTFYSDGDTVKTQSNHYYGGENEFKFVEMIAASAQSLSGGWLSSNLSHISLSFEDDYGYDADNWIRIDNRYASENFWEEDQVVHMHNSEDEYTVTTYRPDGTHSKLCGAWSEGESSLIDCTE